MKDPARSFENGGRRNTDGVKPGITTDLANELRRDRATGANRANGRELRNHSAEATDPAVS